jgi:hypothetical protein
MLTIAGGAILGGLILFFGIWALSGSKQKDNKPPKPTVPEPIDKTPFDGSDLRSGDWMRRTEHPTYLNQTKDSNEKN